MSTSEQKPLFRDLTAEDPDPEVTEIESLCVNCHENGMTRLLLTRIPHYRNVVIMSFSCEHCGFENNEIQPGGAYAELGIRWKLNIQCPRDLNRQVVKSDHTAIHIPELDFEIPAMSQKGEVTTVEGIISRAISGLTQDQESRREQHPADAEQIDQFVEKLEKLKTLEVNWTLVLEDISGNCFIENPEAPRKDPRCERSDFKRSKKQDNTLGIYTQEESLKGALSVPDPSSGGYEQLSSDEVLQFRTNCPDCNAPADTNMKITSKFVTLEPSLSIQSNVFRTPQPTTGYQPSNHLGPRPMSGVSHYAAKPIPSRPQHDWTKHGNPPPSNDFKTRKLNFNDIYDPQYDYDSYDNYYNYYSEHCYPEYPDLQPITNPVYDQTDYEPNQSGYYIEEILNESSHNNEDFQKPSKSEKPG